MVTRFGKLLHMENDFYRLRPINNGREITPNKCWDKLMRGPTPRPEDRIVVETYSFETGPVKNLCYVLEVRTSKLGLDEVIVPWMPKEEDAPGVLKELGYKEWEP